MKQQNLCNHGFILLEAVVGVALFVIIVVLTLHGMAHLTKQCAALQGRHKALCAAVYSIEQIKKGEMAIPFFDETTHITVENNINTVMPYNHVSVHWHVVKARSGLQSITLYYAENAHVQK